MHDGGTGSEHSPGIPGERPVHGASEGRHRKNGYQFPLAIQAFCPRRLDSHAFDYGGRADLGSSRGRRGILERNIARSAPGTMMTKSHTISFVFPKVEPGHRAASVLCT